MWLNHVNSTYETKNTPEQAREDTCWIVMCSYSVSSFLRTIPYTCRHSNSCLYSKKNVQGVFANRRWCQVWLCVHGVYLLYSALNSAGLLMNVMYYKDMVMMVRFVPAVMFTTGSVTVHWSTWMVGEVTRWHQWFIFIFTGFAIIVQNTQCSVLCKLDYSTVSCQQTVNHHRGSYASVCMQSGGIR